jgi:hypothetical protein
MQQRMESVWAITWRPGDKTDSFLGKAMRPRTSPVCITQSSEVVQPSEKAKKRNSRGKQRECIHFNGYLAQVNPITGDLVFGGETANCFAYDFGMRPHPQAVGRIIDVETNPALVYTGLEMHKLRQRAVYRNYQLPTKPRLPECYLGFHENRLPDMEDTPALRQRVARSMRKPIEALETMGDEMLQPFLRAEWASCFRMPAHPDNDTGLCLISHQLCSQFTQALRDYLCFSELMGAEMFNPVRNLLPAVNPGRQVTIANPAKQILQKAGYDPAKIDEWAEELSEKGQAKLVKQMRTALGDLHTLFTDDDIVGFIGDHQTAIVPPVVKEPLVEYGEETTLRLMRHHCGRYSDCCQDSDLLEAARAPNRPLYAAGLVRVQTLYAPKRLDVYYTFSPSDLGLQRVQADFLSIRPWWRRPVRSASSKRRKSGKLVGTV